MRTITIQHDELKDLLLKKGTLIDEGRNLSKKIELEKDQLRKHFYLDCGAIEEGITETGYIIYSGTSEQFAAAYNTIADPANIVTSDELESMIEERKKIALQVQKVKDQTIPIVKDLIGPDLGEFEEVNGYEVQGNDVVITVIDRVEEFKEIYLKEKNQ